MGDRILPVGVSALACAIAEQCGSAEELQLLSTVFVQLGDTLATIAAARACAEKLENGSA